MAIIFTLISLLIYSPVYAENTASLEQAIKAINELPIKIQEEKEKISHLPLGPFKIEGSCEYDKVLFWNTKTEHWSTSINFAGLADDIIRQLDEFNSANIEFSNKFHSYKTELINNLDSLDKLFQEQNSIYSKNNAIPDKNLAKQALKQTTTLLENSIKTIEDIMLAIGELDKSQSNSNEILTEYKNQLSKEEDFKKRADDFANKLHCGGNDFRSQHQKSLDKVRDSLQKMTNGINNVCNNINYAIKSTELLLGTMQTFLSRYSDIEKKLNQASTTAETNAVIGEFYMLVTKNAWGDLAKDARAAFK